MIIDYQVIPHSEQRYPTVGDWWWEGDTLHMRVSKMSDERYEWLVMLHETIECIMCKLMHINEPDVTKFDEDFEAAKEAGQYSDDDEAGDDEHAPYRIQHAIASVAERAIGAVLGVDWNKYNKEVVSLYNKEVVSL